jgi:WD40 repeat protein
MSAIMMQLLGSGAGGSGGGSYLALNKKSSGILTIADHTSPGSISSLSTIQVGGGGNDGYSCQWSSDDSFIVATTEGNPHLHLINSSNPASLSSTDNIDVGFRSRGIALSPDDSYVAVGHWNGGATIKVYSISSGSLSLSSTTTVPSGNSSGSIESLDFSPDGNYLAIYGRADNQSIGHVWLYSHSSGSLTHVATAQNGSYGGINFTTGQGSVRFSADGTYIASAMYNKLKVFSYNSSSITEITSENVPSGSIWQGGCNWKFDGSEIAAITSGGTYVRKLYIYTWNGSNLSTTSSNYLMPATSYGFAWSPDGKYIAASCDTSTTSLVLLDVSDSDNISKVDDVAGNGFYTTGDRIDFSHN